MFNATFVENNRGLITMVVKGKERGICEYLEIDYNDIRRKYFPIILKNINTLEDFKRCFMDVNIYILYQI